jgi:multidrug resistance efflux pump
MGIVSEVLKKVAALPPLPDATPSDEKRETLAKLRRELEEIESETEQARQQLQGLGLVFLPDAEMSGETFLKLSGNNLTWLENQFSDLCRIGRELSDEGVKLHNSISIAHDALTKATTERRPSDEITHLEKQLAELKGARTQQQEKVAHNKSEQTNVGKLLRKCHNELNLR